MARLHPRHHPGPGHAGGDAPERRAAAPDGGGRGRRAMAVALALALGQRRVGCALLPDARLCTAGVHAHFRHVHGPRAPGRQGARPGAVAAPCRGGGRFPGGDAPGDGRWPLAVGRVARGGHAAHATGHAAAHVGHAYRHPAACGAVPLDQGLVRPQWCLDRHGQCATRDSVRQRERRAGVRYRGWGTGAGALVPRRPHQRRELCALWPLLRNAQAVRHGAHRVAPAHARGSITLVRHAGLAAGPRGPG